MLTRCPHCQSWFRVRAEQLSIANGRVTCGTCDRVFNALATLVDDEPAAPRLDAPAPSTHPAHEPTVPAAESLAARPEAVEPEASEPEASEPEASEPEASEPEASEPEASEPEASEPEASEPEASEPEATAPEIPASAVDAADERGPAPGDDVPALLREEFAALARAQARQPRRWPWWAAACVLFAVLLVLQLALVERAALVAAVPAAAPWLERLCAHMPCAPHASGGAHGVRLVARDVREHPQYDDALLVNATLVNDSTTQAPFPVIELVLHDAGGRAVGARRFAPAEYLDHSMPVDAGMPPRQPVYVVIELAGPDAAATSFEFRFL